MEVCMGGARGGRVQLPLCPCSLVAPPPVEMLAVLKCPKITIHLSRCDDNNLQIIIMETSLRCRNVWNFAHGSKSKFKVDFCSKMIVCIDMNWGWGSTPITPRQFQPLAHRPHTPISIAPPCALALAPHVAPFSDSWCRPWRFMLLLYTYTVLASADEVRCICWLYSGRLLCRLMVVCSTVKLTALRRLKCLAPTTATYFALHAN